MDSLLRKKLLIAFTVALAYFLYVSMRIKNKRNALRPIPYLRLDNVGGPVELMKQCRALGPVFITIEKGHGAETFEKNAKYLFKTDFEYENVCKIANIDICNSGNCVTVDMKYFIVQYFRELEKRGVILRKRHSASYKSYIYDIIPDSLELKKDSKGSRELIEGLMTFGMMIGLVMIHSVYLEMKFERHFLHPSWNTSELLTTLEEIDPDQYNIYRKIKYDYGQQKYKFVPKSPKPFRDTSDPDPLAVEYPSYNYPFYPAAHQIFIDPFAISRDSIYAGIKKVCGIEYNITNEFKYYVRSEVYLNWITAETDSKNPTLFDLKDNIDSDANSKLFLRALRQLNLMESQNVYEKVTGFHYFPVGGFSRLPRIKIVSGHAKIFPKPFLVVIELGINENDLVKRIRESIDGMTPTAQKNNLDSAY